MLEDRLSALLHQVNKAELQEFLRDSPIAAIYAAVIEEEIQYALAELEVTNDDLAVHRLQGGLKAYRQVLRRLETLPDYLVEVLNEEQEDESTE